MSEGTDVQAASSNLPATAASMGLDTGLEDFDTTDMVMPRLSIDHGEAVFVDNLTGERHPKLRAVVLGLIKQRILWNVDVGENEKPLCKSFDFRTGHPNGDAFPWAKSGFDRSQAGSTLPCDSCVLKEWDSHPQRSTPWCSEQHTFPVLMETGEEMYGAPALLTVQRSAIKASKAFLTGFARSKTPVYTVVTELSLDPQKKGSVNYAVPRFIKVGNTRQEDWPEYAEHYRNIRSFVSTPPPSDDDNASTEPASAPVSSAGTSATGAAAQSDDDLPF
jgi:hypothetical protein